jgi:hypothetical protein
LRHQVFGPHFRFTPCGGRCKTSGLLRFDVGGQNSQIGFWLRQFVVFSDFFMFVKRRDDETLIKVVNAEDLIDPFKEAVEGKQEGGQSEQPPESFEKSQLVFPSGESLPQCWMDPKYREKM